MIIILVVVVVVVVVVVIISAFYLIHILLEGTRKLGLGSPTRTQTIGS